MKLTSLLLLLIIPWYFNANVEKGVEPIRFQIYNAGISVNGIISNWEFDIQWDSRKPTQSQLSGKANPGSINTGITMRDKHLLGRQYFHIDKFPAIILTSKQITSRGKNQFVGTFDLQIRDVKKEIEISFTVITSGKQQTFKAEFSINRLDYGLGEKSLVLSDDVKIFIEIVR